MTTHPLFVRLDNSGIWEGFIPDVHAGEVYKYHIHGFEGMILDKGDPFAHFWEKRPLTASITWELDYEWKDAGMDEKPQKNTIHLMHLFLFTKCTWPVGCGRIKMMKKATTLMHK